MYRDLALNLCYVRERFVPACLQFASHQPVGGISRRSSRNGGGTHPLGEASSPVWTTSAARYESAPHFHLPLLLALWTGQRQGDLLRLSWSAYDGTHIRLRQSKTGARVVLPVGAPLKAALDAAKKHGPLILTNSLRRPWTSHGFQASWRIAATKAGIVGVTFHDLRGTAVTRLAIVGCTEAEIATITGHSLRDVRSILDANYLHRDPALAESAIKKLERGTKFSNQASNRTKTVRAE
jgi:integrase